MNNLIELGRETFEFAHSSIHDRARTNTFTREERKKLGQAAKKGEQYGSTAAGAGAGALAGAGAAVGGSSLIAKRRRAEKDRIKKGIQGKISKYKRPQSRSNQAKKSTARTPSRKVADKASANTLARAQMRMKYGKNWYRPGGSKKKLLGYGALAGAALGGAAGYYARKKKGDS
jgi:hypothetical protein